MSSSNAGPTTIRWIFVGLLGVVVASASYVGVSATGWTVPEVPAAILAAPGAGCLVLAIALFWWFRRSRFTPEIELRLDRIASPTTLPESRNSQAQIESGDPGVSSDTRGDADAAVRTDTESQPAVDRQSTASGMLPEAVDATDEPGASVDVNTLDDRSVQPAPSPPMTAPKQEAPLGGHAPPSPDAITEATSEDAGLDALRLAALLNQYEQAGCGTNTHTTPRPLGSPRDEHALGEGGLWSELVQVFGAESIDLHDISAGRCSITLKSGNMVFYVPEYRQWVWLVFERADTATSTFSDQVPIHRSVHTPARTGSPSPTPPSLPDLSKSPDGAAASAGAQTGLTRLARFPSGRSDPSPRPEIRTIRVVGMAQVLSSQNTPAAYEEALFVTEGLLLGGAYGNRVIPYEELVWVVEAATGHSLRLQSMGRFLGDLVERSYPRHMDVLSALAVPASASSESAVESRRPAELGAMQSSNDEPPAADGTIIDLTDAATQSQHETAASQSS